MCSAAIFKQLIKTRIKMSIKSHINQFLTNHVLTAIAIFTLS